MLNVTSWFSVAVPVQLLSKVADTRYYCISVLVVILWSSKVICFDVCCDAYSSNLLPSQRKVAVIAEMIHTASLMHDDVIDSSDTRRGHPSVQRSWGQRRVSYISLTLTFLPLVCWV